MMVETKIPLVDLDSEYSEIGGRVKERIAEVFDSRQFILGPQVAYFEDDMAKYCEVPHAIGLASGTDALTLSLLALGIGKDDEVITTPFTFFATASTIVEIGARPVFVDVEPDGCLIDPDKLEEAITHKTRAIVPVHLFGQCADMDPVNKLAKACDLVVVEDACQAIGADYNGVQAGGLGDAAALSFYPSKNLGGIGDGGMALTTDKDVAEKIKSLRVYGTYQEYGRQLIGTNSRLDAIQAAVLATKLEFLNQWTDQRIDHALQYDRRFADSPVRPLKKFRRGKHVYNNYVIRVNRRDELVTHLAGHGIGARVYYDQPLHQMNCFAKFVGKNAEFPEADRATETCLAIPCFPGMSADQVDQVADVILAFYGEK